MPIRTDAKRVRAMLPYLWGFKIEEKIWKGRSRDLNQTTILHGRAMSLGVFRTDRRQNRKIS